MEDGRERMDRRGFLSGLLKAAAAVTAGAAVLGGCKCGEEDVQWSDEDDSSGGGEESDRKSRTRAKNTPPG
jgi:hypothetical protein